MSSDRAIRLFVVDDHEVVRMGVKSMFDNVSDIDVVGTAASGPEALEQIPCLAVDVVLTDLRMKEMSGDTLLIELQKRCPDVKAAVLTNYHSDEDVFNAMKAGTMAYILKDAKMEQVVEAVRNAYAGVPTIPAYIAHQLAQRIARNQLSARELEVLQLISKGDKNREIADRLYISENTVRNHVISLLDKLGCRDRTEATSVAIRQGLIRVGED